MEIHLELRGPEAGVSTGDGDDDDDDVRTVDIQMIKVGVCQHTESCHGQLAGHKTECRQLFLEHMLVAITSQGEVIKDIFLFPSCCSCHVINTIQYR